MIKLRIVVLYVIQGRKPKKLLLPVNYEETIFDDIEDLEEQLNIATEKKLL